MESIKSFNIGKVGKIIIPAKIENYIDILHKEVGSTEWSGILFYKLTGGDIKKFKDLEFTIEFLYPMDIGTSAYTEFKYNEHVMNAYDINEDLIECSNSLVHSHHNMSAFFSGTDTSELLENAKNFNYYISLIVNFNKSYVCKIAFPSKSIVNKKYTIKDQDGKLVNINSKEEVEEILVGDLDIEFENKVVEEPWLLNRIKELKQSKVKPVVANTVVPGYKTYPRQYNMYDNDDWDFPVNNYTKTTSKGTVTEFLAALLNLDIAKKNEGLFTTLNSLKTIEPEELQLFDEAIALNIENIYSNIFPDDYTLDNLESICLEALTKLNDYLVFKNEDFMEIIKFNLKEYVL